MSVSLDDSSSDMSPSSEHPIPTYPMQVDETLQEIEWQEFFTALSEGFLSQDDTQRVPFDHTMHYEIGDPHTSGGGLPRVYDQSTEVGGPDWQQLFQYLLRQCRHIQYYEAVYLLVDTRDLTVVDQVEPSLAHWPAVAAWWSSRLRYVGPREEQVDLVFVRACKSSGLHLVHPTWAGTFVLAALVFLFPKTHFVLLDSDCVPVTLFEIEELWMLTTKSLFSQAPTSSQGADSPAHKARKTQQDHAEEEDAPRVVLVTEPHTDINAGFVVIFGSQHSAPMDIEEIDQHCAQNQDTGLAEWWEEMATMAYTKYRAHTSEYLCNFSDPLFLTSEEQGQVLQSGLALSPIAWQKPGTQWIGPRHGRLSENGRRENSSRLLPEMIGRNMDMMASWWTNLRTGDQASLDGHERPLSKEPSQHLSCYPGKWRPECYQETPSSRLLISFQVF